MTDQEKELIDYAAKQFEQAMMKSNPFPVGMSESISFTISTAIERSISMNSHLLAEELKKINQQNLEALDRIAKETAAENRRHFFSSSIVGLFGIVLGAILTSMLGRSLSQVTTQEESLQMRPQQAQASLAIS